MPRKSKHSHQLKALQSQRTQVVNCLASMTRQGQQGRPRYRALSDQLAKLEKQISDINKNQLVVTEHALLRYIERVHGVDLDAIHDELLSDTLVAQIEALGDGCYPIGNQTQVRVKNNVIVTVVKL